MSSWRIAAYVKELRGVSSTEKAVLFVLAEYYNRQQKVAWPEQGTLAAASGISERTLKRVLQSLETARAGHPKGILRRSRRHAGRSAVTNYHFVDFEERGEKTFEQKGGQKGDTKGDIKGDNPSVVIRNNDQTIKRRTLPNPPLQGGNSNSNFKLTRRDHARIAQWIKKTSESYDGGITCKLKGATWADALRMACVELMIPFDDAKNDLLLMDEEIWSSRLELKKEPQKVRAG